MENLILENSFGFLETFLRIFGEFRGILQKLTHGEKIKNFHQFGTNKENEVLRPLQPPNSLGGRKSDLKFMALSTYATMCIWAFLTLF